MQAVLRLYSGLSEIWWRSVPCGSCCSSMVSHPGFPICPCSTGCFAPVLLVAASFPSVIFLFCCPSCPGLLLICLAPTLMVLFALFTSVLPALIPSLCVFLPIPPALALFSQHLMSFLKCLHRDTISLSNCFSSAAQCICAVWSQMKATVFSTVQALIVLIHRSFLFLFHYQNSASYALYCNGLLNFLFGQTQTINLSSFSCERPLEIQKVHNINDRFLVIYFTPL